MSTVHFRLIAPDDRDDYLQMVRAFYATDAVMHPIPDAHILAGFEEMLRRQTYAIGVMFEQDSYIVGYALLGHTFSQEAGGMTLWLEELYVKPDCRGQGIGKAFLQALLSQLPPHYKRVRLEVERDNTAVVKLYESVGFSFFEYDQMVLERQG